MQEGSIGWQIFSQHLAGEKDFTVPSKWLFGNLKEAKSAWKVGNRGNFRGNKIDSDLIK